MKHYDINNLVDMLRLNSTPVILFGAGSLGKPVLYALKALGIQVDYFCDSDKRKQGKRYCGVKVISPEELSKLTRDAHIFICNNYIISVSHLLEQMNFKNIYGCEVLLENTDFSTIDLDTCERADPEFYDRTLDIERLTGIHKSALKTNNIDTEILDIKCMDIVITECCSLKCQDCANLMQYYVSPKHSDLDLLFRSVDKLLECIDWIYEFRVTGGEAFTNKEIHKIIYKLVSCNNVGSVAIYTNATIVPKDENLLCLKNKKVKLDITNYGYLSRNYNMLIETLKVNNIKYVTHVPTMWTDSGRIQYHNRTESELAHAFINCCVGDVLTLLNGKIYRCPFSANAHNLNAIPFNDNDVISLFQENKNIAVLKSEIKHLYTRKKYLTACAYCGSRDYNAPKIKPAIQIKKPLVF